jgi:ABC-type sugar transport system ATPase subunit
MRNEIRNICKEHQLTTIHVIYDQKEPLSAADRIIMLSEEKIGQIGTPMQL